MKIGNREVLHFATFFLKDGEVMESVVEFPGGSTLRYTVKFLKLEDGGTRRGDWSVNPEGRLDMIFHGWSTLLGSVSADPHKIGDVNGKPLSFQMASYLLGDGGLNLAHIWFYSGE